MGNYHKTFFLHGISHSEAVILSDTRHEQTASIPRSPISFKFFPRRYAPRCLFFLLFSAKNTLVAFFFLMTADWCEREKIILWKSVCLLAPMQSLLAGLKSWWIKGGKVLAFGGFVVFLEQTGVTD